MNTTTTSPNINSSAAHNDTTKNDDVEKNNDDNNSNDEEEEEEIRKWKASMYAVGYTGASDWKNQGNLRICCCDNTEGDKHLYSSKYLSSLLCRNAGRIGNMVVLYDSSQGQQTSSDTHKHNSKKFIIMIGPHWPTMMFVTYPLIIAVSLAVAILRIPHCSTIIRILWSIMTIGVLLALANVSCRNPGILLRKRTLVNDDDDDDENNNNDNNNNPWIWNDQALTYRPKSARYDKDCACIIEEYDHTCPWTGTAIGKNNMIAFRIFTYLIFFTFVFDMILFVTFVLW